MMSAAQVEYQRMVGVAASRPDDAQAFYDLGCGLHDLRRWGASAGCFARSLNALGVDCPGLGRVRVLTNLAWNQHLSGRSEGAEVLLREAIALAPNEGLPHMHLSLVLGVLGRDEESLEHALIAVGRDPGSSISRVALSFALFFNGKWDAAWREFEGRFAYRLPQFTTRPYPMWRGERVGTLLIECEQGLGDAVFASRWFPLAAERADRVLVYSHKELVGLFRDQRWERVEVYAVPRPLPPCDAWCPAMSLPVALGSEVGGAPYLRAKADAVGEGCWRDIGIVWAGSDAHEQAHLRDAALPFFLPLSEIPGVWLHGLQVGPRSADLVELGCAGLIEDRAPEITNMADTARILGELDLVITVDTAVAHLAGAMGVPCWMLVNQRGVDFRWGRDGRMTRWYDSLRLWRRDIHEDWPALMRRVEAELRRDAR